MIDNSPQQYMQTTFAEPTFRIYADMPASLRILWFTVTNHDNETLYFSKYAEDVLSWLVAHEISQAWFITSNHQWLLTRPSTKDEEQAKLRTSNPQQT